MMKKEKKVSVFEVLLIMLWGVCPLLWFMKDSLVTTIDLGLPLSVMGWRQYIYAWDQNILAGFEWTRGFGFLTFNAIETLTQLLGFSMIVSEKISFIFWFVFPGFSFYYLMRILTRKNSKLMRAVICLTAANFYMFNLFLESMWRGNRSGLSAYAAGPLVLAFFLKGLETGKFLKNALLIALASVFLTAAIMNQPIIAVWLMGLFIFYVYYIFAFKKFTDKPYLIRSLGFCFLIIILCLGINMYAILPNLITTFNEIKSGWVNQLAEISSNWIEGTSYFSSFYNVARIQASWTWYQGWQEPYHTYSLFYRTNHFFIVLSWLFLVLVIYGIAVSRNRYKWYFLIITIATLILSMGTHWPFAKTYRWMMKNIPFFVAFRSPWYKFSLLTCAGYAYFIGFGAWRIHEKLSDIVKRKDFKIKIINKFKKILPLGVSAAIMAMLMLYAFPVVTGKMFAKPKERQFLWADHIKIPDYVFQSSQWLNEQNEFFRIITLPTSAQYLYLYHWHYASNFPVIYKFVNRPVLFESSFGDTAEIVKLYYDAFYNKRGRNLYKILNLLGARYILHELDSQYNLILKNEDSPEFIRERLDFQKGIKADKSFGSWNFYSVAYELFNDIPPHAYLSRAACLVKGKLEAVAALAETDFLNRPALIFSYQQDPDFNYTCLKEKIFEKLAFYNTNTENLIFDLINKKNFFELKSPEAFNFKADKDGLYQFWAEAEKIDRLSIELSIDDNKLKFEDNDNTLNLNWQKLGSCYLRSGSHRLKIAGDLSAVTGKLCIVSKDEWDERSAVIKENLGDENLNLAFFVSTRDFKKSPALKDSFPQRKINIIRKYGFDEPELWPDGRQWSWLRSNGEVNFLVENLEENEVKINFCFTAYSLEILRGLQVIVNDGAPCNIDILPDKTQEVIVEDVILKKGINTIKFFTAYQWSYINGKSVRLAFLDDFRFCPLMFSGSIDIPESRNYSAVISPANLISIRSEKGGAKQISASEEVFLEKGTYTIDLIQQEAVKLYDIGFVFYTVPKNAVSKDVLCSRKNPAKYKLGFKTEKPYFLIFSEAYHPQWKLTGSRKIKSARHIKINGYANGWYIKEPGDYSLSARFAVQDWFHISLLVSICVFAVVVSNLVKIYKKERVFNGKR